ncbi:hypothetical protein J6590_046100 [Homalodisca vitripennis]|nr:hypothetical protein J6590_046100 [Homalodisca vitripennis]
MKSVPVTEAAPPLMDREQEANISRTIAFRGEPLRKNVLGRRSLRMDSSMSEAPREGRPAMPWDVPGCAVEQGSHGKPGPDVVPLPGVSRACAFM